tara:strand:- start:1394 stop:1666 length:273 start_codon:yes stop_codon:yes gene_type:complete
MLLVKKRPSPHSDEEGTEAKRQRCSADPDAQLPALVKVIIYDCECPEVRGVAPHVHHHDKEVKTNIIDNFVRMVTIQLGRMGIIQSSDPD